MLYSEQLSSLEKINPIGIYQLNQGSEVISELLLIQKQTDLIGQIMKSQIGSKKSYNFSTEISELSFDSNHLERQKNLTTSFSAISLCKQYSKFFQGDSFDQAMNQIRRYCSKKTFNLVRDKLRSTRESRYENRLQKQLKYNQQLTQKCLKLTQQVSQLKIKLSNTNERLKIEQRKKVPKAQSLNIDRGQVYLKWEKAILYKQKMQAEVKKTITKQFRALQIQKSSNESLRQQLQNLVSIIQDQSCVNQEQIAQIVSGIQSYLNEQRKINQEQEKDYANYQLFLDQIVSNLKEMMKSLNDKN